MMIASISEAILFRMILNKKNIAQPKKLIYICIIKSKKHENLQRNH